MQLRSVRLDGSRSGDGAAVPVELDSEQTLVLVFGAASLLDQPGR